MRIHHANIRAVDPVPLVDFYRLLGLKLTGCYDLRGPKAIYMGIPEDPFLLEITVNTEADAEWQGSASNGHLAITVPDLEDAVQRLTDAGVALALLPFHPGGREEVLVCFVDDPYGNRVELIHGDLVPPRDELPAGLTWG